MSDVASTASGVVSFFSDPATLVTLGAIAAGAAWYLSSQPRPLVPPIPLDNQSLEQPGEEHVRISHLSKDGNLVAYRFEDAKTLYEVFQRGKRVSADGPCLGKRSGPGTPYEWVSYSHVEGRATAFGAGLATLGVETGQDSFVSVYSHNRIEWVVAEQSCIAYSRVLVPLYNTLGPEQVSYILNQATVTVVVCSENRVLLLLKQASQASSLRLVISMGDSLSQEEQDLARSTGITLHTMAEVEKMGKENPLDVVPPSTEDLALICFTSGTTGPPKGVMMSHGNMVSNLSGIYMQLETVYVTQTTDTHISYLPMAHMIDRMIQGFMLMCGGRIGIFQGDMDHLVDDMRELRPTFFVSVPNLFNKMYDKAVARASTSTIKKWLFERAVASKLAELKRGIIRRDSIWDKLVFRRLQDAMGGRLCVIVTGAAPISGCVLDFIRVSLGCRVFEGYGQTECMAAATVTLPGDAITGHVGAPLPCTAVKLIDAKEMNYFAENKEGEVCLKGPNVFKGYLKNPEKTAEAIDEDGWLHSGDIGKWLPNGTLKIIDRKKHLFKLSLGRFLSPERIENIYGRSMFVAQAYVHGDSLKPACVAIIVPDEEVLSAWAVEKGISGTFQDLCANETIKKMLLEDITKVGKELGLKWYEEAGAISLWPEPFTVENGLLTPTFKLKRLVLKKKFMDTFVQLSSQLSHGQHGGLFNTVHPPTVDTVYSTIQ